MYFLKFLNFQKTSTKERDYVKSRQVRRSEESRDKKEATKCTFPQYFLLVE